MSNVEIKETEYYNCPYCHRIIPDYAICNCVKIYNQALEDALNVVEWDGYTLDIKERIEKLKR